MYNLLVNWDELLAYFTAAELAPQQFTSKTKARLIKDYLRNRDKYLYFQFFIYYRNYFVLKIFVFVLIFFVYPPTAICLFYFYFILAV